LHERRDHRRLGARWPDIDPAICEPAQESTLCGRGLAKDVLVAAPGTKKVRVAVGREEQLERRTQAKARRAARRRRARMRPQLPFAMDDSGSIGRSRVSMFTGAHLPSPLGAGALWTRL
jgi:hypothetical protein